ncbi:ComEA family DNA-binding protein [Frankia sp. AiPs1]|uniref:helix-hairpin-helix domain-containing protein n=1 Tax=Frankia sp. AiPs1 TaxID=573493 RepID=UPI0020442C09|nr:ComEA family DNA-binding protein [Frankia sp. AiPs1]MCM3923338.1 ComEA family DNA-binding protein [Frankia sp. AiPs1]
MSAGAPHPSGGVREGVFAEDVFAEDEEWLDSIADTDVPGWGDRHDGDGDGDGRPSSRGSEGGAVTGEADLDARDALPEPGHGGPSRAPDRPAVHPAAAPVGTDLAWAGQGTPPEGGWRSVRERLARRFPASLRGVVTAPAASATLVLALVALAAGLLATWFAWQHRPVSVAAPVGRPSTVVAAPSVTGDGGSADPADPARADTGQSAAAGAAVGAAATPTRAGAADEVVVDVAGRVTRPGVVRLPAGSRVVDAIDQVGGVLAGTDTTGIGLARVLVDGEQILVDGRPGPPPVAAASAPVAAAAAAADGGGGGAQHGPIDLNSASSEQLDGLPGVGPVLAGRIVQWRTEHGPFRSPEQLGEVTGLGDKRLADLLPLVKV